MITWRPDEQPTTVVADWVDELVALGLLALAAVVLTWVAW
jgi:hypothetical protein